MATILFRPQWSNVFISTDLLVRHHTNGLVQDYGTSIANTVELLQSCSEPYKCAPILQPEMTVVENVCMSVRISLHG